MLVIITDRCMIRSTLNPQIFLNPHLLQAIFKYVFLCNYDMSPFKVPHF